MGDVMISKSTEEYLKTIYILKNNNEDVSVTNIASIMHCSKPSVTKQLNILNSTGMIEYHAYGSISLTESGESVAKKVLASYDILYLFLKDVIKIDKDISKVDAEKIKSVISDETLNGIVKYVYKTLGLDISNCNYNIKNEKCRECFYTKKESLGSEEK